MSTPSNTPCFASETMRGTSRWQWGHQCATNSTTCGLPFGATVTGAPSKTDFPVRVGIVLPTAGSGDWDESYCGSGLPVTVTAAVSYFVAPAWSLPPPPDATTATTIAITTT